MDSRVRKTPRPDQQGTQSAREQVKTKVAMEEGDIAVHTNRLSATPRPDQQGTQSARENKK